jgi:proteic killer suppression protein
MKIRFADKKLEALYLEGKGAQNYPQQVVTAFTNTLATIQTLENETLFYRFKSWRVEKLSGKRAGEYSIRLNKQFRLVYTLEKIKEEKDKAQSDRNRKPKRSDGETLVITVVVVLELVDYH